ncbi:MAG: hypothetical protein NZ610_05800 [Candidatus Bipolaricaulota bacterium]|nr:hypothetical protein [Candidatus Bipolaricaulota bacterium]MCS7274894.1 hypothetical protein [Candidatus Bipolaricaulota bacterium]MDW8111173.1 hypothetical protein [Candidatus Bipolaricaulota bacterium]MDW8329917.1 hypothetical protein [Candidatus Bipolaricaulota bacterium]
MKSWWLSLALLGGLTVPKPALAEPAALALSKTHWVLLHGVWPGSSRDWRLVAPLLQEQGATVWRPTLPGRVGLFPWADNIAHYVVENAPSNLYVIAHSFSGAATLLLLRTAYELQHGDLEALIAHLDCDAFTGRAAYACRQLREGWQQLVADRARAARWIQAAQKIKHLFLYHPALRGACGACWDRWGLWGGDATASLCLLAKIADWLFTPLERVTWRGAIAITNLYGGSEWMLSLCGLHQNDLVLGLEQQRLFVEGHGYREVLVGNQLHFSFAMRRSAAQRLIELLGDRVQVPHEQKEVSDGLLRR